MKFTKLLFPVFVALVILSACAEKYEEATGPVFQGTYVWRYTQNFETSEISRNTSGDTSFIEIKTEQILRYNHGFRDSLTSIYYFLDKGDNTNIYGLPLSDTNAGVIAEYDYYRSYRFNGDTLYLEKYPTSKDKLVNKDPSKILLREAWVRPGSPVQ